MLLSLLVFELILRTKIPNRLLPQPSPYYSEAVVLRDRTLAEFKRKHGEPELVVIGSSVAYTNVHCGLLGSTLGKRAFGLGLPGLAPGSVEQFWRNHWKQKVPSAKTVLLVLRARDVISDYVPLEDAKLMGSRIERGWIDIRQASILDRPWVPNLRLKDYYGAVSKSVSASRKPLIGQSFWNDEFGNQPQEGHLSATESERIARNPRYSSAATATLTTRSNWLDQVKRIRSEVNGRFIVVYSPDLGLAWESPQSATDWGRITTEALRKEGIETVSPTLDNQSFWMNIDNYGDVAHMHRDAAAAFTSELARDLAGLGL